ncbi:MAG TPA: dolichyl-phosphate beta-glucosyltransferase [Thermoanaerobaculia bacterium]|nr:dolichyl-phosphate beta-glucosyltransferase [Thermoanaerobaculia bacterium]
MACELSVVIPAYNEARRLGDTLRRTVEHLTRRGLAYEVLVVDDGSGDGTAAVAETFATAGVRVVRHERNRGKGAAVRTGVLATGGARVLLTDADLSTPIEELAKLEARLPEAPLVLGSRAVAGADIRRHQPLYRELMGKIFNRLIRLLGVRGLHDTQCGFKLLDGAVARDLAADLTVEGFAYDVELVVLARRRGHRVVEVGVVWEDSPDSRVDPLRSSVAMLRDVAAIRFRRPGRR